MQATGGVLELAIIAVPFLAFLYWVLEPLCCWLVVGIALLLGFGHGRRKCPNCGHALTPAHVHDCPRCDVNFRECK